MGLASSNKAQRFRSQEKNRADALGRLQALIGSAMIQQKLRAVTKPSRSSIKQRIDSKTRRGALKGLRGRADLRE